MNESKSQRDVQEMEEITNMLRSLPQEKRTGFNYAIKGACLISDAQALEDGTKIS